MIKVIKSDHELGEDRLNQLEAQGLTLISANHIRTMEYPEWSGMCESKMEVIRWVYHFRCAERKPLPQHVSHGSGETSL